MGEFCRLFQNMSGEFFLLGSSGLIFPTGLDGKTFGDPARIDLAGYRVEYSGFGVSVPRTGRPLRDVVDVVLPTQSGKVWATSKSNFRPQSVLL